MQIREGRPKRYGFHTNAASKTDLVTQMTKRLREILYIERDKRALDEIEWYELKPDGSYGARRREARRYLYEPGNRVESLATDKYTFGAEDGERSFGNICYFYGSCYVVLASLCGEKIYFLSHYEYFMSYWRNFSERKYRNFVPENVPIALCLCIIYQNIKVACTMRRMSLRCSSNIV